MREGIGVFTGCSGRPKGPVMRQQLGSAALRAYEDLWAKATGIPELLNQAKTTKEAEQ
jgi:hypothetical protein